MQIEYSHKGYTLTEGLREFIAAHLHKVQRFFGDEEVRVKVLLKANKHRHESEISIHHEGEWLQARAEGEDMEEVVLRTIDHLQTQLKKTKKKLKEKKRREAQRGAEWIEPSTPRRRAAAGPRVERLGKADIPPMTEAEALARLARPGAAFVLYRDLADDRVRLLAERPRGGSVLYDLENQ
jgi:putative sigma-54 modulation protein